MTLTVKFYNPPIGRVSRHEITEVYPEDEKYFKENDIVISMEPLSTGEYVIYGCYASDKSEESELMVVGRNRSCKDMLKELAMEFRNNETHI